MVKFTNIFNTLKTLGRVLRTKSSDEEWEELLNSEIWNLPNEGHILPALRLSYYDLPPHLKQMFTYCCLFPKDCVFDKDKLVMLWMAEGFLYQSNGRKSMESLGRECFEELVSRSLFQHSTNNKAEYTMHDLVNDLAISVAGEYFFMLDEKMSVNRRNEALEKFRHFSFIHQNGIYRNLKALYTARRLRTFLPVSVRMDESRGFYLSRKFLTELLPNLRFLRVLSLANSAIKVVPQSIGSLKHLRYLNFSYTYITCLPEEVGNLYNLQSLLLCGCHRLSSLPKSLVKLINLRHLDISNTMELNKLPVGIGGLRGLQTLSKVIIGDANGFKISHLKDLQHLQGRLTIEGLHNVTNATHAKEAKLQQKKGLRDLEMEWSYVFDDSRNELSEYEVLEGLRPSEKLTSLKILSYMGTKFPSWVGDPSYDWLTQLRLHDCGRCTCLPTLGHLRSLQKLFVESMNGLKRVDSELLGNTKSCNGIAFPSLEILEFKNMEGWEEWSTIGDGGKDGTVASFPSLHKISIRNCPKLDVVAIDQLMPSLRVLNIEECCAVLLRSIIGVSSSITRLTMKKIKGLNQLDEEVLEQLRAVEYLSISKCDELIYLWESEVEACKNLVNLEELEVEGCKNLIRMGEKKVDLVISMEFLRNVRLKGCERLESYHCGSDGIEKLEIRWCDSMTSLTFPTVVHHHFPFTLRSLHIWKCKNMRLLPEGCLLHLTHLAIDECENIESIPEKGYGFLPHLCLRSLDIIRCKNIKSFPHERLQSLTSLEYMSITKCSSMDSSFPGGLWPPNLRLLNIGGLKKAMSEWGMMQNFPNSLVHLSLDGNNSGGGVVSFANAETTSSNNNTTTSSSCSFLLPSSLTSLEIYGFKELETLSKGMEHLTSLKELCISNCPKLRDLPETLLPSLSSFSFRGN